MSAWPFERIRVAIRGGGDLGSGVAYRLHQAGFPIFITELDRPHLVRRAVSFGSAVIEGAITVEGITARRADDLRAALAIQQAGEIPVLVDPDGHCIGEYSPAVLVDARMLKTDPGQQPVRPLLLIGLGPGFHAPLNCDVAIETNRGHNLGRAIYQGVAEEHTHLPGTVQGHTADRVLRAPADGVVTALAAIGDTVRAGDPIARVGQTIISAPFDGVLRGLIHDGIPVEAGRKIGDLDPRARREYCFTISEKSLAVGGGVLEAILSGPAIRDLVDETA